jgi:hypothetical protein
MWLSALRTAQQSQETLLGWPEGLSQWNTPVTQSEIESATFRLVAQRPCKQGTGAVKCEAVYAFSWYLQIRRNAIRQRRSHPYSAPRPAACEELHIRKVYRGQHWRTNQNIYFRCQDTCFFVMKVECLKFGGVVAVHSNYIHTQYTLWAKCKRFWIVNLEVYLVTTHSFMEKILYHLHKKFQESPKVRNNFVK